MLRALPTNIMDEIKKHSRIIFMDGMTPREGVVLEVSPSRDYIKLEYVYLGCVVEYWFQMTVAKEILASERIDE